VENSKFEIGSVGIACRHFPNMSVSEEAEPSRAACCRGRATLFAVGAAARRHGRAADAHFCPIIVPPLMTATVDDRD